MHIKAETPAEHRIVDDLNARAAGHPLKERYDDLRNLIIGDTVPEPGDPEVEVRGLFIRAILTTGVEGGPQGASPLAIKGVWISGRLDLEYQHNIPSLSLIYSRIDREILLSGAKMSSFILSGSICCGVKAILKRFSGSVYLEHGFESTTPMTFNQSVIENTLIMVGAQVNTSRQEIEGHEAFNIGMAEVKNGLFLRKNCAFFGVFNANTLKVGGSFAVQDCHFTTLPNAMKQLPVDSDLTALNLIDAHIGKDCSFVGGSINLLGGQSVVNALTEEEVMYFPTAMDLSNSRITGTLVLAHPIDDLSAEHRLKAVGRILLTDSVLGRLDIDSALLRDVPADTEINTFANVNDHKTLVIFFGGCRYDGMANKFPQKPHELDLWISQFRNAETAYVGRVSETDGITIRGFYPKSYEQLSDVLAEAGYETAARYVLIQKERRAQKLYQSELKPRRPLTAVLHKFVVLAADVMIRFGYEKGRMLYFVLGLLLISSVVFYVFQGDMTWKGTHTAANPPTTGPLFYPLIYVFENTGPLPSMGQGDWRPNDTENPWLLYYLWAHRVVSWFLTTILVGGYTGMFKLR